MDMDMVMEMETPMPANDNQLTVITEAEPQPSKRRKKKSIVWEHFTIETISPDCRRASCNQCQQSFAYSTGSKVAGTSHLKRHIAKGTCAALLRNQDRSQSTPYARKANSDTPKRRYRTSTPNLIFDQDRSRYEIANMMIMHDYPLHMVEHQGFLDFVHNLQPRFDMVTFNMIQGDCVATYLREKQGIMKLLEGIPGRICLALDMWSSNQTLGYVFLTGQYVDSDWKSHRRLLNVVMEPFPDSDATLSHAVAVCLSDWGLENRLFSLTIDQPLSAIATENLRAQQSIKNTLVLNGQLLIPSCLARTLSSMAKDIIAAGQETIKKVRDSVKYVKISDSHEEKFLELRQQLQIPSTKSLVLDSSTCWNTTYDMLIAASEFQEVFSCLDTSDHDYKEAMSVEDWKMVTTMCSCLKLLFDTGNILTSSAVPTANIYFHEVCKIQMELARAAASQDQSISIFAKPMQQRFDNYWKESSLILATAVVMDPRFKMKLVEFSFTKIYGEEADTYLKAVDDGIHELFLEYVSLPLPLTPTYAEGSNGNIHNVETSPGGSLISINGLTDFDAYIQETTSQQSRSELDMYLEESLLPRVQDFDVSHWWKLNRTKYPTLSQMARDILSIPVCTMGPDSIFDTSRKEMDGYQTSLRPETVEALICAKDWLQQGSSVTSPELVKVESLV